MATQPTSFLTRLNPREVWHLEPSDFTPWLAEPANLAELGRAIGAADLTLVRKELRIGRKSADLLARDQAGFVLIENQLEETDHGHLGQILTYLAGLEGAQIDGFDADGPVAAVWVATAIGDEHRAAIDWLNDHTPERFSFYAVELRAYCIGDSDPAPDFRVVTQPNTKERSLRRSLISPATDKQARWQTFWEAMRDGMAQPGLFRGRSLPRSPYWDPPCGVPGFKLAMVVQKKKRRVRSEIFCGSDPDNVIIDLLRKDRGEIERAFGEELTWEPLENKSWRVASYDEGIDIEQEDDWPRLAAWFEEKNAKFLDVIVPRLRAMDAASLLKEYASKT